MAELLHVGMRGGYGRKVVVPRSFRVSPALPFSRLLWSLTALRSNDPKDVDEILGGQWVRARGGPLPIEIAIRIDRADDGRFIVTGLLIGLGERREITWETLRQIKLATVLDFIFTGFDPRSPLKAYVDAGDDLLEPGSKASRAHTAYELWNAAHVEQAAEVQAVTRPRASVATNLTEFAEVYMRHLATDPHRATKRTADEMHISRATVIRRVEQCRELGLIPRKGTT